MSSDNTSTSGILTSKTFVAVLGSPAWSVHDSKKFWWHDPRAETAAYGSILMRFPNPPQFEDTFGNRDPLQARLAFLVLDLDLNVSLSYDFFEVHYVSSEILLKRVV